MSETIFSCTIGYIFPLTWNPSYWCNTPVQNLAYEKALDAAHEEIADLVRQCAELEKRIVQLKVTADALTALMGISPELKENTPEPEKVKVIEEPGINNAIRQVLRLSPVPLTPGEIKTKLIESGFDTSAYSDNGTTIQTTLKQLERQGDVSLVGSVYLAVNL
jgi:hypothetical protein